ncbi:MAG: anthranilate phosphoribosyltransferase [Acidobacteriota bacterium]
MASSESARQALRTVLAGDDLTSAATEELFGRLMDGELSDVVKAALLGGLAAKGEAIEEIAGAASAMRARAVGIPHTVDDLVDTCGTGGDGKGTFNVSTAAAIVAAGAGVPVAKHGNRSVSSRSGSADVLAALGVDLEITPEQAGRALEQIGLAFLFAPKLHPAMREVMPVRKELGVRTIFNLLGPLTNPAGAARQVMGVYAARLVEPVAHVLARLGATHALVVHGADGLDEITTTGPTHVAEVRDGAVTTSTLDPAALDIERAAARDLLGGEPDDNAEIFRRLLDGEEGPIFDIVVANAGAAIFVGGRAPSLRDGAEQARVALRSGAAHAKLEALRGVPGALEGES